MRKYIFLDFDGVLNTENNLKALREQGYPLSDKYGPYFDPTSVANLATTIEQTKAEIVISSTWKIDGLDIMKKMWIERSLPGKVIDITPSDIFGMKEIDFSNPDDFVGRGREIQQWIGQNGSTKDRYMILDDLDDMLQSQKPVFIQIDPRIGITEKDAQNAIEILTKKMKTAMNTTTGYRGRGIHDPAFLKKLEKVVDHINKHEADLDLQIRDNYVNIYYKGGNICKITGVNSINFDPFYFYLDSKEVPRLRIYGDEKQAIPRNQKVYTELKDKAGKLLKLFREEHYAAYFKQAKEVMNNYWKSIEQESGERKDQQELALANKYGESDYTILDLEYQVSELAPFRCTYIKDGKSKPKKPRFDIIAIDKSGQLVVIELKKGTKALDGTSGLKEHYDCYNASIGRNTNAFMTEMRRILEQKQELELLPSHIELKSSLPQFMFAFTYADEDKAEDAQRKEFIDKCAKVNSSIPYIILPQNTFLLK